MRRMFVDLADLAPERRGDGWTGVEKIDVATALDAVPGRHLLLDVAVLARPARAPLLHFDDALRPVLAKQPRKLFVAQAAAGLQRIFEMQLDRIRFLPPKRDGDGHLRHDRRAAAADLALVDEKHRGAIARRGDRRIHAGAAGADYQYICRELGHDRFVTPPIGNVEDEHSIHGLFAAFLELVQGLLRRFLFGLFLAPTFAYA